MSSRSGILLSDRNPPVNTPPRLTVARERIVTTTPDGSCQSYTHSHALHEVVSDAHLARSIAAAANRIPPSNLIRAPIRHYGLTLSEVLQLSGREVSGRTRRTFSLTIPGFSRG